MNTLLKSPFSFFFTNPSHIPHNPSGPRPIAASIRPPPPGFDFRDGVSADSRATISTICPQLLDLADNGALVLVQKCQYGPVPPWRTGFVEPEAIWLLGTSHISQESAEDVARVIRALKPDNVVVELCRSRAGIMYVSENGEEAQAMRSGMFSLSGTGFFGAVGRSLNLGGQTGLALRLLLATLSSKVSSNVKRPFGEEFRAARKSAEEVGAQLVLGDRPIEITLERTWNSLTLIQQFKLVLAVIRGITSSSKISVNGLKEQTDNDSSSFQLFEKLSFSFPSLLHPLIHERDTYLAWSLKRSKAVNGSKTVVGVIGKGHMNGVIYALLSDSGDLRFRDLVGIRRSDGGADGWLARLIKSLVRDTVIAALLWALYERIKTGFPG